MEINDGRQPGELLLLLLLQSCPSILLLKEEEKCKFHRGSVATQSETVTIVVHGYDLVRLQEKWNELEVKTNLNIRGKKKILI